MLIRKYEEMVESLNTEPKDKVIVGCFLQTNVNTDLTAIAPKLQSSKEEMFQYTGRRRRAKETKQ